MTTDALQPSAATEPLKSAGVEATTIAVEADTTVVEADDSAAKVDTTSAEDATETLQPAIDSASKKNIETAPIAEIKDDACTTDHPSADSVASALEDSSIVDVPQSASAIVGTTSTPESPREADRI
ncbi:hypothetical protein GGH16_001443, partial [Coemansia sp. RSA 560]